MGTLRARIEALEELLESRRVQSSRGSSRAEPIDLMAFAHKYVPHYMTVESAPAHVSLMKGLSDIHRTRLHRHVLVGSRGTAKSVHLSFLYVLACFVHGIEPYTIVASETTPQASLLIAPVKSEIEDNAKLRKDFPLAVPGGVWTTSVMELKNGCRLEAVGTGKAIRGRRHRADRPSLIVIDDPESEDAIRSDLQRQRTRDWMLRAVLKAGAPDVNVIVAENAIHRECLAFHLGSLPEWKFEKWPSIVRWPERMDLWAKWEELYTSLSEDVYSQAEPFYQKHKDEMHKGAELLWPARETLLGLMKMRAEGHAAFEAEKQCNPVSPTDCEWPSSLFDDQEIYVDKMPTSGVIKGIGLDPSKGRDGKRGDYSAIVKILRTKDGTLYVEADLRRRDSQMIAQHFAEQSYYFRPDVAVLEQNANQDLLGGPILDECDRLGYVIPLTTINHTTPKPVRIRRLSPWLHRKKFRFLRTPGTMLLVNQLRDFPVGDHDDGPDALEMTLDAMITAYNGRVAPQFRLNVQGDL